MVVKKFSKNFFKLIVKINMYKNLFDICYIFKYELIIKKEIFSFFGNEEI